LKVGTSRTTLCVSARALLALLLVGVFGLLSPACGGDDEDSEPPAETAPATTAPPPVTTPPPEAPGRRGGGDDPDTEPRTVPPEEQGDEEPIRSEAVFTGTGGRLTPREVRVPAFIAIRVILRSTDDRVYTLRIGGSELTIGAAGRRVAELELDGLLPDEAYRGKSPQGNVRVVASAEPGP
jgi:hypothetical protein